MAIVGFKDERLAVVLAGNSPGKGFPTNLLKAVARRLRALDVAVSVDDLRQSPGNRLEALKGDRAGQYSVRINDQFRLCFVWTKAGPADVEFVDYH